MNGSAGDEAKVTMGQTWQSLVRFCMDFGFNCEEGDTFEGFCEEYYNMADKGCKLPMIVRFLLISEMLNCKEKINMYLRIYEIVIF